ncbi:MAG TPA: peptidylprolyl isomerase [Gaiellaceae bacterium]
MRKLRILLLPLALFCALLAAACGGSSNKVPGNAVARVGSDTITKAQFDAVIERAKKGYKTQKRPFPAAGTPEYQQIKQSAMQFLVQRAELEQKAHDYGIKITKKQIEDRVTQIKKQLGGEKAYKAQVKANGLTEETVRSDIVEPQLISEAIYKKVTGDIKVTDKDVKKYYDTHPKLYQQPESRDVRHILVKSKKQADQLYARLKAGADFATLAKKYSKDPGSAVQGGKLTIVKGQTVGPFDQTAFLLKKGQMSRPVKTQYGYHIIQAISEIRPPKKTPFGQVKESIRQQQLRDRQNAAMAKWVKDTKKDFEHKIHYQVGYAPPKTTTSATTTG